MKKEKEIRRTGFNAVEKDSGSGCMFKVCSFRYVPAASDTCICGFALALQSAPYLPASSTHSLFLVEVQGPISACLLNHRLALFVFREVPRLIQVL